VNTPMLELGLAVLDRVANYLAVYGQIEQQPGMEGRQMVMVRPRRKRLGAGVSHPTGPNAEYEKCEDQANRGAAKRFKEDRGRLQTGQSFRRTS